MSFSKTVSVVAALASIFSVGLASWKISEDIKNAQTAPLEQKIEELERKLEQPIQQVEQQITPVPNPVVVPPIITEQSTPVLPSPLPTPPTPPTPSSPSQQ